MDNPHLSRLKRTATRGALGTVLAGSLCVGALAEVRSSTQTQSYSVGGTTAASLVSYMRSNPFHGSKGDAVANIRPNYALNIATSQNGGTCRASKVTLNIRFVMTLPRARSASAMGSSTRSAWNSFVAFSRRHEETHRSIYVKCGNDFVAKAERMTASSCAALQASIRKLLETDKAVCEGRQRAFDRADYGRVASLGLFRMARGSSRASR
jgi:predicted secreted Zn-dependent protease